MKVIAHHQIIDAGTEQALLAKYGILYSYGYAWSGGYVSGGPFTTQEECHRHWASLLKEAGYTKPKWRELSRWGERQPHRRVLEILERGE